MAAAKRRTRAAGDGAEDVPWLTAYADLITAILAVIVLMLASGVFDGPQAEPCPPAPEPVPCPPVAKAPPKPAGPVIPREVIEETRQLERMRANLSQILSVNALDDRVALTLDERGLAVVIEGAALFASNEWKLAPGDLADYQPLLDAVTAVVDGRTIEIEGHTDDLGSDAFNLDLSARRALSMLGVWTTLGYPTANVRIAGYGETRPARPLTPGLSEFEQEQVRNTNRRISFLIHRRQPPPGAPR